MERNNNENFQNIKKSITMNNLKTIMKEKGYDTNKLSKLVGISPSAIDFYTAKPDKRNNPTVDTLIKISNVLDCNIDFLYDKTNIPTKIDDLYNQYVGKNRSQKLHLLIHFIDNLSDKYIPAIEFIISFLLKNDEEKWININKTNLQENNNSNEVLLMDNLTKLVKSLGYKIEKISNDTLIKEATLKSYINSGENPLLPNLIILEDYLNCNSDFLLDKTIIPTKIENIVNDKRSDRLKTIIEELDKMNDKEITIISIFLLDLRKYDLI